MLPSILNTYRWKKDDQMKYIIFDLEWNQPVNSEKSDKLPHGEIIQIGFITADDDMKLTHREELMIKPQVYLTMNPYVSTLTGITQSDIDGGMPFPDAIHRMAEFFTEDTVLITWGDDDIPILQDNWAFHEMGVFTMPTHYNLQRIFSVQTGSFMRQTGLRTALEALGITEDVKAHDALNDAYMTYLIASKLDMALGIERYSGFEAEVAAKRPPWETEKPLFVVRSAYGRNPSGMCAECRRIHFSCPRCGKDFFGTEPIRQGKNTFVAVGECHDLGQLFFRFTYKDGYINTAAFAMNDEFDMIYKGRVRSKEKRDKRREMFRDTARSQRKAKKPDND